MAKQIGIVSVNYEGTALCYRSICIEAASLMASIDTRSSRFIRSLLPITCAVSRGWIGTESQDCCSSLPKRSQAPVLTSQSVPPIRRTKPLNFMRPRSPLAWLHIVEVVGDAAAARRLSKLGILGTRFLMEGNLYREVLSERGIESVIPDTDEREKINTLIFEELLKGTLKNSTREYFRRVASELVSKGCDAVVMGCTEIPLILRSEDFEVPLLDSTRLLAKAALEEALRGV
jgi:aspartate racemase